MAAVLCSVTAFSQTSVRFGLKAGGNMSFSKHDIDNSSLKGKSILGFWGGGLMEISPSSPANKFKLQLEVLYSNDNFKFTGGNATDKINAQQINVPVLAKYFITPSLSINAGPTFNFNIAAKETTDTSGIGIETNKLTSDDYKSFQIGAAVGATYYLYKGLFIDARYNPLFGQWNKAQIGDGGAKYKFSTISLGVGYKF